jgi:hypothetical protein
MTDESRRLAVGYFNGAWELIDLPNRTAEQERDMLTLTFAARQHWIEAGGTPENLAIADWQVAHAASKAGFADLALAFARSAVAIAEANDVPTWLKASTHEALARAHASAGEIDGYTYEADLARSLLDKVADSEDRTIIESQLASVPSPQ